MPHLGTSTAEVQHSPLIASVKKMVTSTSKSPINVGIGAYFHWIFEGIQRVELPSNSHQPGTKPRLASLQENFCHWDSKTSDRRPGEGVSYPAIKWHLDNLKDCGSMAGRR